MTDPRHLLDLAETAAAAGTLPAFASAQGLGASRLSPPAGAGAAGLAALYGAGARALAATLARGAPPLLLWTDAPLPADLARALLAELHGYERIHARLTEAEARATLSPDGLSEDWPGGPAFLGLLILAP